MDWLNYHHLHYFWLVAREGSIARAAEPLLLTHPTISKHLLQQVLLTHPTISKHLLQLEVSLKDKLFDRVGRNLVPPCP